MSPPHVWSHDTRHSYEMPFLFRCKTFVTRERPKGRWTSPHSFMAVHRESRNCVPERKGDRRQEEGRQSPSTLRD